MEPPVPEPLSLYAPPETLALLESQPAMEQAAPSSPLEVSAAEDRRRFEAHLPDGPEGVAWKSLWTWKDRDDPEALPQPFPFVGSKELLELNDVVPAVEGLRALGAQDAARGVLENWLDLGERFTALPGATRLNELGRAGLPRLSSLFLEESERHPDPAFLPRAYAVISGDYRLNWSDRYFHETPTGLTRFTDVDYSHEATMIEAGGQKNEARFEGDAGAWNAVDLNAWLYRTEKDMETMARTLEGRARAEGRPEEAGRLAAEAGEWARAAQGRKNGMLTLLWDPSTGSFRDWNFREQRRSNVPTLASYAMLAAGVLDPSNPRERGMIEALAADLDRFVAPGQELPAWNAPGSTSGASEPADPADLAMVADGLARYGFGEKADSLRSALRSHLARHAPTADVRDLGVRAALSPGAPPARPDDGPTTDLVRWMSPAGRARLERVAGAGARIRPADAGVLDRRLRALHESMLDPGLLRDLQGRGLLQVVYGVGRGEDGTWRKAEAPPLGEGRPLEGPGRPFNVAGVRLTAGVPGASLHDAGAGAVVLEAGGRRLPLVRSGDHLVVGDRAYSVLDLPRDAEGNPTLDLPRTILADFSRAGQNPSLEAFYDANREWLAGGPAAPPSSAVEAMPGRPAWKGLFDLVGRNWKDLTFPPSVVARDTSVQYFNAAAVPSVGIFKTQFNWDSYFMARGMELQGQGGTVVGMADNLLYLLKSTGRVPNAARSVYLNKSQPPVLPMLVKEAGPIREAMEGKEAADRWLSEAHELMTRDYEEFWNRPGPGQRGISSIEGQRARLSRYGGDNHKFAMDESGFDTTSRLDGRALDIVPVELNSFLWTYSREMEDLATHLADRAREKGDLEAASRYTSKAVYWKAEAATRKADLIRWCWDDEDGMFRDRAFQGPTPGLVRDQDSLAPTVAPLWVGMLDPSDPREQRMIERSLDNVARFEKEHGLAAMASDYGHPEMQWNGPSGWAPLHVMGVEALTRYGRYEDAARITGKWLDTLARNHERDGVILERYDMTTGGPPPVQKGRYEETQGAGPGFGWTNATLPWALVEIVGGGRVERPAEGPAALTVAPHLPSALEGKPVVVDLQDPAGKGAWRLEHLYRPEDGSFSSRVSGDFGEVPRLEVTTPPLPRGRMPQIQAPVGYRVTELSCGDGRVRYRVAFEGLQGRQEVNVRF